MDSQEGCQRHCNPNGVSKKLGSAFLLLKELGLWGPEYGTVVRTPTPCQRACFRSAFSVLIQLPTNALPRSRRMVTE